MKATTGNGSTKRGPTLQSILDLVACQMFYQNMPSKGPVYNGANGYNTAVRYKFDMVCGNSHRVLYDPVGVFISDNEYHPCTEGNAFHEALKLYPEHFPKWMTRALQDKRCRKIDLLGQLQRMHDNPAFWSEDHSAGEGLRKEFKRIAKTHRLKVGVINKLEPGKQNYDLLEKEEGTSKRGKQTKHRRCGLLPNRSRQGHPYH